MYDSAKKLYSSDTFYLIERYKKDVQSMAKSPKTSVTTKWANANITADDEISIIELCNSTEHDPIEYLLSLVADGASFSIKWRDTNSDYLAFLFEPASDLDNTTIGLSAFATDIRTALVVLAYKHRVICGGYAGNSTKQSSNFG